MRKKLKNKPCIYCAKNLAGTRDHVPPKNLFCKPKPDNLITVPACLVCNKVTEMDEDFFLATIMFTEAGETPEGKIFWDDFLRRMFKKNPALRGKIRRSLSMRNAHTPSGIFLGDKLTLKTDPPRLERVAGKIVKGLYYFEFEEALPPDVKMEIRFLRTDSDRIIADKHNHEIIPGSRSWPIFRYGYGRLEDEKEISVWRLIFFERVEFFIITGNPVS